MFGSSEFTSAKKVAAYEKCFSIFTGLLKEMRELSKKKPDAELTDFQIKIINRVLDDAGEVFEGSDQVAYLDRLTEKLSPRNSDAVLVMVQYESALKDFESRFKGTAMDSNEWSVIDE